MVASIIFRLPNLVGGYLAVAALPKLACIPDEVEHLRKYYEIPVWGVAPLGQFQIASALALFVGGFPGVPFIYLRAVGVFGSYACVGGQTAGLFGKPTVRKEMGDDNFQRRYGHSTFCLCRIFTISR